MDTMYLTVHLAGVIVFGMEEVTHHRKRYTDPVKVSQLIIDLGGLGAVISVIHEKRGNRKEVAEHYGVHVQTIHNWYHKIEPIREAIEYFSPEAAQARAERMAEAVDATMDGKAMPSEKAVYGALLLAYGSPVVAADKLEVNYVALMRMVNASSLLTEAVHYGKSLGDDKMKDMLYSSALGEMPMNIAQRDIMKYYINHFTSWKSSGKEEDTGSQQEIKGTDSVPTSVPDFLNVV